jgi:flagellar FliL protein
MAQATVAAPQAAAPAQKKSKKLLFIAIGVVVLAAAGGGAAFFLSKGNAPAKAASKEAVKAPALYLPMDPPFVVNFQAEQAVRYLQVTVQLMTREQETLQFLKSHDPIIRNDLLLLFGNQPYATISTVQGKEALRTQALETVRKAVAAEGGKADKVEAVYFTSFVIQ